MRLGEHGILTMLPKSIKKKFDGFPLMIFLSGEGE